MKTFFNRFRLLRDLRRLAEENASRGRPLCVMDDIVFKAMLTSDTEDSREALRSLLSACTRREVSKVRVMNNDLIPAHLDAKAPRVDVHVTFNDGEAADLEMQIGKSGDNLKTRAALLAATLLSGRSRKGHAYKEIKRVYQIFFLNCVLFPQDDKIPRRYSYREETANDQLTEVSEIIFYEMPKLEQRVRDYPEGKTSVENLREDEKWCIFMKYRHEERAAGLIKELQRKEAGIMRAEKAVSGISRDYVRAIRKMNIIIGSMDRAQERYDAREEGLQEGLQEGREKGHAEGKIEGKIEGRIEGKIEIAKKMKAAGRPLSEIVVFTGLDMETVKSLEAE